MSVTGTENAVMAAVLAKGTTIIRNAASEPHVQDLCHLLNCLGAQIEGIGTNTLTIQGVDRLGGGEFTISPDYLEVGSFLGLGAVTRGEIRIHGVVPEHMRMINFVFADRLGVDMRMRGRHPDRRRRAGPVHPRGHRRRRAQDRRCALAAVPRRPDEHRPGGRHPGAGHRADPREDVREPPLLRGQADRHGRHASSCATRTARSSSARRRCTARS